MGKVINPITRLEVLQSCIIPTSLYGCQTLAFSKHLISLIQVRQYKMERKIMYIRVADKIRNEQLRRSGLEDAATAAHLLNWRWGGHAARMDQESRALATTVWDPRTVRRNRGWPRHRWSQEMKTVEGMNWMVLALHRWRWKETIKDLGY